MLHAGNPMLATPGMILFMHAILIDRTNGNAMSAGWTTLITQPGCAVLSALLIGDKIRSARRDRGHRRIAVRTGAVQRGPAQAGQV